MTFELLIKKVVFLLPQVFFQTDRACVESPIMIYDVTTCNKLNAYRLFIVCDIIPSIHSPLPPKRNNSDLTTQKQKFEKKKYSFNCNLRDHNIKFYFVLSLRAGRILQILQSDWFRERAVFYDLAR